MNIIIYIIYHIICRILHNCFTLLYNHNVYKNNDIKPLIKVALDIRQVERQRKYNATEKYEIPKKVLNIKDVEKNPDMLEEYLGLN